MKEKSSVDPQLWQACAGSLVQIPPLNSHVFYFPQGHAEHSQSPVNFPSDFPNLPAAVLCRVAAVEFLADQDSDEVFSKLTFVPIDSKVVSPETTMKEKPPSSFAKTLTQSDANNGGGFSVPRYCAETIFPRLDYAADPPVQTVVARDVHGEVWKFRHIYRGTPRRHLLTTGWSAFVNRKKLVAGDSIVFLRTETGDLCVGIRRAKRGGGGKSGGEKLCQSGWGINANSWCAGGIFSPYGGVVSMKRNGSDGGGGREVLATASKVTAEDVLEAARSAAEGRPFTVLYYPRGGSPEFYVKADLAKEAMRIRWSCGMRFKMAFETEDSSRVSWFNGTVASVQVSDPIRWPNSPWRLLQVTWDEPDLLQNVRRVSPWLVELVSSMPMIQPPPPLPFSPPRKKSRFDDFPLEGGRFQLPCYTSNNTLKYSSSSLCYNNNTPAGIQGARHSQIGASLSVDLQFNNSKFFPSFEQFVNPQCSSNESVSCLLTIGSSSSSSEKPCDHPEKKKKEFLLFGQVILTQQQMEEARNRSSESVSQVSSSESDDEAGNRHYCCKVFIESEDSGRTIDLTAFATYEELYTRLADMFGMERAVMLNRVLYRDAAGSVRRTGEELFSVFSRTASRLTIVMNPAGNISIGRTWMAEMTRNVEIGLEGSNKRGALSLFA
ncbi:Auxin response factor 18 [Linum perenne]